MPDPGKHAAVVGWDIGGAHVKACRLHSGIVEDVAQWPVPLWQGLEHLDRAIAAARQRWPDLDRLRHAVTMTAEMTDHFPDRAAGVTALVDRLSSRLHPGLRFFAGAGIWLDAGRAMQSWQRVASANWLATAQLLARRLPDGLLLDVGSTTTDIIAIREGKVLASAAGDAGRLAAGELVYLGVVRTPLCALADRVRFGERQFNVMNELFATTADVFRLTGELDPRHDQYPAADAGSKDALGDCRRLARMIGHDAGDAPESRWREFANQWRDLFEQRVATNLASVIECRAMPAQAPIVGAGCGLFVARRLAQRLGRDFTTFREVVGASGAHADWVDTCAPSVAIARLFEEDQSSCG